MPSLKRATLPVSELFDLYLVGSTSVDSFSKHFFVPKESVSFKRICIDPQVFRNDDGGLYDFLKIRKST